MRFHKDFRLQFWCLDLPLPLSECIYLFSLLTGDAAVHPEWRRGGDVRIRRGELRCGRPVLHAPCTPGVQALSQLPGKPPWVVRAGGLHVVRLPVGGAMFYVDQQAAGIIHPQHYELQKKGDIKMEMIPCFCFIRGNRQKKELFPFFYRHFGHEVVSCTPAPNNQKGVLEGGKYAQKLASCTISLRKCFIFIFLWPFL